MRVLESVPEGRSCDAKCYNATPGRECTCICGGANHGAGLAKAIDNVAQMFSITLEEACDELGVRMTDIQLELELV